MRRRAHRIPSGAARLGLLAWTVAVAVLTVNGVVPILRAQQKARPSKAQMLTALDYIEIRQLVARYGYAVDTGADNGNMYADLFAPDGAFLDRTGKATTGRDALAAVARRFERGPQSQFHFLMNHVIEPTADGARGKEYLLQLRMGEPDHENEIFGGGHYEDTYEKTARGWRFKTRQFIPSDLPAAGAAPGAAINGGQAPLSAMPLGVAASGGTASASPLTVLDYLQIQQLAYRYGWALDSGADNGFAYADLYTPDGIFTGTNQGPTGRSYQGRDKLAALARGGLRGPLYVSHYATNVVVEAQPEGGATGHTYVAIFKLGADGKPTVIEHGGRYDDVYQKTPGGWRFKHRTYYDSKSGEPVQPPPQALAPPAPLSAKKQAAQAKTQAASGGPSLSAEDYIGIQDLVARYPFALDGDVDEGASYANLFTPDAVFRQPLTEGREKLAALAMAQPHGPQYARHFITNHVIDAAPGGGATGKEYLVVVDLDAPGKPGKVFLAGHYDDTYAKTAGGWRFKTRTFVTARPGTPAAQ
jgi:hypothetical protein